MALDISKVTRAVNALGESAATYAKELNDRLALARATFNAIAADPAELTRIADEVSRKFRWAGAIPTRETINGAFPLPQRPARFNVIAADGSQIYPDRHGIALYYLINVGSIVFRHGLSDAPSTASLPEVFFEDEDLYYEEENSLITTEMINANRDVRELGELARLTKIEAASAPTTALLDNSLLLYISLREQNPKFSREVIEKYLA
ncbi:MAG TPA: DNA double-strand break repair nuclease NurA, partial [Anaerolineales bacterium]|nr:DNA double-strand break repair nuclease NurA [Anaerolineales bacterium]